MKIKRKDEIEKLCKYCEHAAPLSSDELVLCSKNGVVHTDHHCSKFIYDPLKRTPIRAKLQNDGLEFPDIND